MAAARDRAVAWNALTEDDPKSGGGGACCSVVSSSPRRRPLPPCRERDGMDDEAPSAAVAVAEGRGRSGEAAVAAAAAEEAAAEQGAAAAATWLYGRAWVSASLLGGRGGRMATCLWPVCVEVRDVRVEYRLAFVRWSER